MANLNEIEIGDRLDLQRGSMIYRQADGDHAVAANDRRLGFDQAQAGRSERRLRNRADERNRIATKPPAMAAINEG